MNLHRVAICVIFLLIPIIGYPAIVHIPDDHLTIQSAIDAAGDGDTVLIADGVYSSTGNINIQWDATFKHLVIMSENGRDHCIIDCKNEGRGFLLNMGQDHRDVIDGLTITNGWVYGSGGAILIASASPRIINCKMVDNISSTAPDIFYGGGAIMVLGAASPLIQGNIIRNNCSNAWGGGIEFIEPASGVVENNVIDGNESTQQSGGGIALINHSDPLIINNLIINN